MLIKFNRVELRFWPHCAACGILVPGPMIEPILCAAENAGPPLDHWENS